MPMAAWRETLTIDRDQDVVGWARQITDGAYESVATIPVGDGESMDRR